MSVSTAFDVISIKSHFCPECSVISFFFQAMPGIIRSKSSVNDFCTSGSASCVMLCGFKSYATVVPPPGVPTAKAGARFVGHLVAMISLLNGLKSSGASKVTSVSATLIGSADSLSNIAKNVAVRKSVFIIFSRTSSSSTARSEGERRTQD